MVNTGPRRAGQVGCLTTWASTGLRSVPPVDLDDQIRAVALAVASVAFLTHVLRVAYDRLRRQRMYLTPPASWGFRIAVLALFVALFARPIELGWDWLLGTAPPDPPVAPPAPPAPSDER